MNGFKKIVGGYRKGTGVFGLLGAIGLFLMVFITFADVIMRYFFKHPIVGSQEMIEFLMVITMYGGMPFAAAKGMLLTVDAVVQKFHPTVRDVLRLIFSIACAFCACIMCYKVFQNFMYYLNNPMLKSSILGWSYAPFYGFTTLSLGLLSIEMILEIVLNVDTLVSRIKNRAKEKEGQVDE